MTSMDLEMGKHMINITWVPGNKHHMMYHHWEDTSGRQCAALPHITTQKDAINEARRLLREFNKS